MANQFTTIGNVYSIDLDRFVSASIVPTKFGKSKQYMLVVRLRGSGFLRFIKYSYYRVLYNQVEEVQKDMKLLLDSANQWQVTKTKNAAKSS